MPTSICLSPRAPAGQPISFIVLIPKLVDLCLLTLKNTEWFFLNIRYILLFLFSKWSHTIYHVYMLMFTFILLWLCIIHVFNFYRNFNILGYHTWEQKVQYKFAFINRHYLYLWILCDKTILWECWKECLLSSPRKNEISNCSKKNKWINVFIFSQAGARWMFVVGVGVGFLP